MKSGLSLKKILLIPLVAMGIQRRWLSLIIKDIVDNLWLIKRSSSKYLISCRLLLQPLSPRKQHRILTISSLTASYVCFRTVKYEWNCSKNNWNFPGFVFYVTGYVLNITGFFLVIYVLYLTGFLPYMTGFGFKYQADFLIICNLIRSPPK